MLKGWNGTCVCMGVAPDWPSQYVVRIAWCKNNALARITWLVNFLYVFKQPVQNLSPKANDVSIQFLGGSGYTRSTYFLRQFWAASSTIAAETRYILVTNWYVPSICESVAIHFRNSGKKLMVLRLENLKREGRTLIVTNSHAVKTAVMAKE